MTSFLSNLLNILFDFFSLKTVSSSVVFVLLPELPWATATAPKESKPSLGYETFLYNDPKHERTKFFNQILPDMYKGASPFLLDGFKTYLIDETESRFKWKKLMEETEHDLGVLFSEKNEASCYQFLSMPARAMPTHIGLISNEIHKLEEMYAHVVEDEKVMQKRHSRIFSKNKLKRWAEEQNTYDETSLQKLAALKDTIS